MSPVIYEITANVQPELCADYERYMTDRHITDVLATSAFAGVVFAWSGTGQYRISYEAHSRAALNEYISDHAPRLRQDFMEHFPSGIELSRCEWHHRSLRWGQYLQPHYHSRLRPGVLRLRAGQSLPQDPNNPRSTACLERN